MFIMMLVKKVQYITDQTLHLVCVGVGAYMLIDKSVLSYFFIDIFNAVELSPDSFIKMLVLILFMNKPANITIKKFIEWYKPYENSVVVNNKKSGAFIGTLERYII